MVGGCRGPPCVVAIVQWEICRMTTGPQIIECYAIPGMPSSVSGLRPGTELSIEVAM